MNASEANLLSRSCGDRLAESQFKEITSHIEAEIVRAAQKGQYETVIEVFDTSEFIRYSYHHKVSKLFIDKGYKVDINHGDVDSPEYKIKISWK
ncbi:hypothetical protein E2L07_05595 [Halalkalibacterium halodurans]|uniref:hypothetical protein n=1 Tax=Halalkalibacterium halodurans TaxID=86665 RepID=UPI001067AA9A|nr:hypothetical protein [Halalkalibacterium halodurans]TES56160.1 hypothetical protein E2L07_05595 [Halalkalibacterium halodurans]